MGDETKAAEAVVCAFLGMDERKLRHLRRFNVCARIVGICWTVLSGIALFAGIVGITRWVAGYEVPIESALNQTAFTGATFIAGVAFLRVRPYRPDVGDEALLGLFRRRKQAGDGPRSWWTGDPK